MRVVFDTNILVSMSFAQGGRFLRFQERWRRGDYAVLLCETLVTELKDVLERPKARRVLSDARRESFLAAVVAFGTFIEVVPPFPEAPDPEDDFLLAMLRDGEADFLVTGDKALLALENFEGRPIVDPKAFTEQLET